MLYGQRIYVKKLVLCGVLCSTFMILSYLYRFRLQEIDNRTNLILQRNHLTFR